MSGETGTVIRRLLADNRHVAAARRAAIAVCDDHKHTPIGNRLQGILDETERRVRFLFEIAQGLENADGRGRLRPRQPPVPGATDTGDRKDGATCTANRAGHHRPVPPPTRGSPP